MKKHLKKEIKEKTKYQKKIRVGIPGIQTLHFRSPEEIGKALSDAFKEENKVIARDENSAFLTKHLRAYGGTGQYDGYTVGRLLRSIFKSNIC